MKSYKQAAALFLSFSLFFGISPSAAFAAQESREKISSVTLNISAELGNDSDFSDMSLQVTAGGNGYSVDEYEVINDTGSASYPLIQITLDADSGYYFDVSARDVSLNGEEGSCTSKTTRNNKETLVLKVKLTDLTADLASVSYAQLDSDGEGSWSSVPGARKYEVRLYRGSTMIGSTKTTSDTRYDFSGMITRRGDYFFKVRAIGHKSSDKSDWTESDGYYFDDPLTDHYYDDDDWYDHNCWYDHDCRYDRPYSGGPDGPGNSRYMSSSDSGPGAGPSGFPASQGEGWQKNQHGWWYRYGDGSYPVNAWIYTDNNWFHFDNSGYMQTGWITDNGRLFYLNPSSDGTQGKMMTGWQNISGRYYYFNPVSDGTKGALVTNAVIDGRYRVGADGALVP